MTLIHLTFPAAAETLSAEQLRTLGPPRAATALKLALDSRVENLSLNGPWSCLPTADDSLTPLTGGPGEWVKMPVPSNWFLRGARTCPPDMKGFDHHGTLWYRKTFSAPESWRGKCVTLEFEAVDYFADVFVNGKHAASHAGCFMPFKADIGHLLKFGGENVLMVRVNSPKCVLDMDEKLAKGWPRRQYLVKGVFGYHDCRPGGTGERGQDANTGGIVGDVNLRVTDGARIDALRVTPSLEPDLKQAAIQVDLEIFNALDKPVEAKFEGSIDPANFEGGAAIPVSEAFTLQPGRNLRTFHARIDQPRLWWTWDLGAPNLYRLAGALKTQGALMDRAETRFGIRTLRREAGWKMFLNNKSIFSRGSNYIATQWLSEMDLEKYRRDIRLMREANLNSIRVHAHIEKDAFYDLCDEAGILVWQDYPFQWGYTDDADFVEDALRQVRLINARLYNHPSILIWCGHNETPWALDWMQKKDKSQNKELDRKIEELVRSLDPTRVMVNNSGQEDGHDYSGWYAGHMTNFRNVPGGAYVTEYGAQALPSEAMLNRIFGLDGRLPDFSKEGDRWRYRNMQTDIMIMPGRVEKGRTLGELVENSQRYQAKLLKFGTECYRRAKGRVQGIYQFMFVECWPSITWAVVDYDRKPKLGFEALRTSMQPVLPSVEYSESGNVVLWVVNDLHEVFDRSTLRWELRDKHGRTLKQGSKTIRVDADSSQPFAPIGNLRQAILDGGSLRIELVDAAGAVLGRNGLESWEWAENSTPLPHSKLFASVSATSEVGPNAAALAVDGDRNTRWESLHGLDPQRISFELREPTTIRSVKIAWEAASAREYSVEVSDDAEQWKTVASVQDGSPGEEKLLTFEPVKARYLRIVGTKRATRFGYSIWEIEVK